MAGPINSDESPTYFPHQPFEKAPMPISSGQSIPAQTAPAASSQAYQRFTPVAPSMQMSFDARPHLSRADFKLDEYARQMAAPRTIPNQPFSPNQSRPFRISWISTERVPFRAARHLRNEWNKGKELKVSRDGTEVEPDVGETLIRDWRTMAGGR